jgi:hypothetical protein
MVSLSRTPYLDIEECSVALDFYSGNEIDVCALCDEDDFRSSKGKFNIKFQSPSCSEKSN